MMDTIHLNHTAAPRFPKNEVSHFSESDNTSDAMAQILTLFDDSTFVETGKHAKRTDSHENMPAGVITGYGAVNDNLIFAFAQDSSLLSGGVDAHHIDKIIALYRQAMYAGAPIVGIFDSRGVDVCAGFSACAGYGLMMKAVSEAAGKIPQIAIILGECEGILSVIASMFDFVIKEPRAKFGIQNEKAEPLYASVSQARFGGTTYVRELLSYLPRNAYIGVSSLESADSLNRRLPLGDDVGDLRTLISSLADNNMALEIYKSAAPEILTFFSQIGGVSCGVCASVASISQGKLSLSGIKKLTRFITFCGKFGIPIVSLLDTAGLLPPVSDAISFSEELAHLTAAYTTVTVPKIAVIIGKAIGISAVLFASHSSGTNIVYATENAEIGALPTASAVAFAWKDRITETVTRKDLEKEWRNAFSSPYAVASIGEIDDVIPPADIRKRVASALLMLTSNEASLRQKQGYGG